MKRNRKPSLKVRLGLIGITVLVAGAVGFSWLRVARELRSPYPLSRTPTFHPVTAGFGSTEIAGLESVEPPLERNFRPGETVGAVLDSLSFGPADAQEVLAELAELADLRRIRPIDRYAASYASELPTRFEILLQGKGRAAVVRAADGWRGEWRDFERRVQTQRVQGELRGSLDASIREAGGEAALAYLMADVLQWDLDFTRDLREGDRFEVLYERVYLDGAFHTLGSVLALTYDNLGRRLEAYRFEGEGDEGYYDAEGRPLRKLFLRSPLKFSRITSRFSNRRFHPVLKTYRPHYGVDYGAPTGTPVRVTANGVVVAAGWNGGGGKMVEVRHPNDYVSAYLHLSRFADGVRPGRRVRQGDVIGYVGATGLATAPHLDYRVKHGGRWMDPLSIKSVPAEPIPEARRAEFLDWRNTLRATLATGEPLPERPSAERIAATVAAGRQR